MVDSNQPRTKGLTLIHPQKNQMGKELKLSRRKSLMLPRKEQSKRLRIPKLKQIRAPVLRAEPRGEEFHAIEMKITEAL